MLNILFCSENEEIPEVYFIILNIIILVNLMICRLFVQLKLKELTPDTKIDFHDGKLNIICGSLYMISELTEMFGINIL